MQSALCSFMVNFIVCIGFSDPVETYSFRATIDGVFCIDARVIYTVSHYT